PHCTSFITVYATVSTYCFPLSLHDSLPISYQSPIFDKKYFPYSLCMCDGSFFGKPDPLLFDTGVFQSLAPCDGGSDTHFHDYRLDRKSTRLNSSHVKISYAVFCLKKKKNAI